MDRERPAFFSMLVSSVLFSLPALAEGPLTKEEVNELVKGAKVEWNKPMQIRDFEGTFGGYRRVTTYFLDDGSLKETWASHGKKRPFSETGKWWVKDDGRLCVKKKKAERRKCSFVVPAQDGGYDLYKVYTEHKQIEIKRRFDKITR